VSLGEQAERPDPVAVIGAQDEGLLGLEHGHPQYRTFRTELLRKSDLGVLELRQDLVHAVDSEPEEVLDPVIGVDAAPPGAHLDQPWPHGAGRGIDPDGSRRLEVGVGKEVVPWERSSGFISVCSPGQAPISPA